MSAGSSFVTLKAGMTLPVEPLCLALDLEARGFSLTQDGDALVVTPSSRLTPADCTAIKRWKLHLLALLSYSPEGVQ